MSSYLGSFGPALANHIWQSTAFAGATWLLTIPLRRNSARARYGLWLATSIKFLIPFSLLTSIGSLLPKPTHVVAPTVYTAMQLTEQPFTDFPPTLAARLIQSPTLAQQIASDLPAILVALWLAGAATVLIIWSVRWRRASCCLQDAVCAADSRELTILRSLETRVSSRAHLPLRLLFSVEPTEPSVYGILKPVLVWPRELSERLTDKQIEAIIAHELVHARRFDNAAAALHMFVEAIFWFHPLVWWMEGRMIEERERACDETVVALGGSADVYAGGILETCRFCVGCAFPCVSAVTGAELRKRVIDIVTARPLIRMSVPKKLLIGTAGLCLVVVPVLLGQLQDNRGPLASMSAQSAIGPLPSFEVASIKPDPDPTHRGGHSIHIHQDYGFYTASGVTAKYLIQDAYNLISDDQLSGGPDWISSDPYAIEAKIEPPLAAKSTLRERQAEIRLMIQSLLADRFKLKISHRSKQLPVFDLVIAKGGPKVEPSAGNAKGRSYDGDSEGLVEHEQVRNEPIEALISDLSGQPELNGRLVIDKTGLTGSYSFNWKWTRQTDNIDPSTSANTGSSDAPSLWTALQEELGLRLESAKAPIDTIVVDHIEQPTPN